MRQILLLIFFFATQIFYANTSKNINIRVLLGFSQNYQITPSGSYCLIVDNKKIPQKGSITLAYHKNGILFNNKLVKSSIITVNKSKGFRVNNRVYRGGFTVHREKNTLTLINNVNLEEYLFSVVPSEVYVSWNSETLKAQAVVARTYALYELQRSRKNKHKKFDVYSDTRSQVYHGAKVENIKTSRAVLQTKGQVLTYNNALIKSYFSSSIGGMSAAGYEIGDNQPYLQPVKSYLAKKNPNNNWSIKVPLKKIQQQYKTTQIKQIGVSSRSKSGRINQIQIKDTRGKVTTVRGDHFRSKLGYGAMKSTLAQLSVSQGNLLIKGRGYGHGVGMGQWEAQELSQKGAKYSQILRHFYKGTKLKKIY